MWLKNRLILVAGIVCAVVGAIFGWYFTGHKYCVQLNRSNEMIRKNREIIKIYDIWMMVNRSGKSVGLFLSNNKIKSIAIYGMAELGVRLYYELKDNVEVKYAMDQNPQIQLPDLQIYKPGTEPNAGVDAVIVTALRSFDTVNSDLKKRGYKKVFALDEILYELL